MEITAILQNQLLTDAAENKSAEISVVAEKSDAHLVALVLAEEDQTAFREDF